MEGFNWSIVGWIAGLVFVYVFGLVEGRIKGRKQGMEEAKQEMNETPPTPQTITADDPGILRIKNESGKISLDLDGNRVEPAHLAPEQRRRLIEILNIMRPWLEGKPVAAPAPVTPPPPAPKPAPVIPAPATPQPKPQAPAPQPLKAEPKATVKKKEEEAPSAPTSIVGQINQILQARIADTPLESKGVSLMESVTGGVNVYVGLHRFEAIDDVPDEEIQAAIRAAIAEWETKYTPGMNN